MALYPTRPFGSSSGAQVARMAIMILKREPLRVRAPVDAPEHAAASAH
jgi:hypothetical protein